MAEYNSSRVTASLAGTKCSKLKIASNLICDLVKRCSSSVDTWAMINDEGFRNVPMNCGALLAVIDGVDDEEEWVRDLCGHGQTEASFSKGIVAKHYFFRSTFCRELRDVVGVRGFYLKGFKKLLVLPRTLSFTDWYDNMVTHADLEFLQIEEGKWIGETVTVSRDSPPPARSGCLNWTVPVSVILSRSAHPLRSFVSWANSLVATVDVGPLEEDLDRLRVCRGEQYNEYRRRCGSRFCSKCWHCTRCGICCHGLVNEACVVCPEACGFTQRDRRLCCPAERGDLAKIRNEAKQRYLTLAAAPGSRVSTKTKAPLDGFATFDKVFLIFKNKGFRTCWHVDTHDCPHVVLYLGLQGKSKFWVADHRTTLELRALALKEPKKYDEKLAECISRGLVKTSVHSRGDVMVVSPAEGHCVSCLEDNTVVAAVELKLKISKNSRKAMAARGGSYYEFLTAEVAKCGSYSLEDFKKYLREKKVQPQYFI